MKQEKTSKSRIRMWVKGDSEFNQQFVEWAKSKGMIAEDLHRMILDEAMQHRNTPSFGECGYQSRQLEHETQ